jgi:hypothetical protein
MDNTGAKKRKVMTDVERQHDHWSMALFAITGENPISSEHRGHVKLMAQDWVEWGKQCGIL